MTHDPADLSAADFGRRPTASGEGPDAHEGQRALTDKAGILTLGGVIRQMATPVLGIVIVRLMSQHDFGSYQQCWVVLNMAMPFLVFGLPASMYYFLPLTARRARSSLLTRTMALIALPSLAGAVAVFASAEWIATRFQNPSLTLGLRAFSLYFLFEPASQCLFHFLVNIGIIRAAMVVSLIGGIVPPVAVVLGLLLGFNVAGVLLALSVVSAVKLLLFLVYARWLLGRGQRLGSQVSLHAQLKYAAPLGISNVLTTASSQIDKVFVSLLFPAAQFAIYSIGAIELPLVGVLLRSTGNVLRAAFADLWHRGESAEILHLWHRAVRKIALIVFPTCTFFFVVAPQVISIIYTDRYSEAAVVFRIFIFLTPIAMISAGSCIILLAAGRPHQVLIGTAATLAVNCALVMPFVHVFGAIGPALSLVLANALTSAYYLGSAAKRLAIRTRVALPWFELGRVSFASLLAAAAAAPAMMAVSQRGLALGAATPIFGLTCLFALRLLGALRAEEIDTVKRWLTLRPLRTRTL